MWISPFLSDLPLSHYGPWQLEEGDPFSPGVCYLSGKEGVIAELIVRRASPSTRLKPEAWELWVYTTGLLEPGGPLRETIDDQRYGSREKADPFWEGIKTTREASGQSAVSGLLREAIVERSVNRFDYRWRNEASSATEAGEHDLALSIYRYYIPVGNCSMDTTRRVVTAEYADLCYQLGILGSYLRLRLQLMADTVPRVVSSSYAEAANRTEAEKLLETGLDIDRFFQGLAIQVDTKERNGAWISAFRLARSIVESDRVPTQRPAFEDMAQDPEMDEWNRTVSALVLAGIWLYDVDQSTPKKGRWGPPLRDIAELKQIMESYSLTSAAHAWLESLRSEG